MKTTYLALFFSIGQLLLSCDRPSKVTVQDVQLEEVKGEENKEEPPPPPPPLSCLDTISFREAFISFCKKQKPDTAASTYMLSVWDNGPACLGVAFTKILPAQNETSENVDPPKLKNSYQYNAISKTDYQRQTKAQILSNMRLQLQEIANDKKFYELPFYSAREIIFLTEDAEEIKLK